MKELEDNKFLTELGKLSTASSRSVAWLSGNFTLGNSSPKIAACWIGIKRKMTRRSQCGLSSRGTLLFFFSLLRVHNHIMIAMNHFQIDSHQLYVDFKHTFSTR